ncbi:MAG: M20/M25/M40 family metallo-hydrolase [Hyphomicrobiales bacterium]|nr:M20/M25/M40 family metallo-hydrolase [Hyphomicrobiales bacterium]
MLDQVLTHIDHNLQASLDRLFALLRIESISTDPAYRPNMLEAADWLTGELVGIGFDAAVRPTDGHPMVVAHDRDVETGPHVLFYGHYDVQPVDPLGEWNSPPFEPRIVTVGSADQIVARGASDDKGQLMTFVEACRAWKAVTGGLPVRVSMLFEGEEESGSPSLIPFLTANAEELKADIALVCDTDMWDRDRPAITVMLRGLVGEEIVVTAADRDLHSGLYGGAARNPVHVLADILAHLHDGDGQVMVPGFYDGVEDLPSDVKAMWDSLGFDSKGFLGSVGLSVPAGETGRSVLEQIWARPTCEVNGITGGYTGEGFKTVIPARASAKVSFRLVGDQQPDQVRDNFRAFVRSHLPADCRVDFSEHGTSPALRLPFEGAYLRRVRTALKDEWDATPALVGSGGSIPVVGDMKRILDLDSLMVGFALDDNRIHSPNEKYDVSSFNGGIRSWARILAALAEQE